MAIVNYCGFDYMLNSPEFFEGNGAGGTGAAITLDTTNQRSGAGCLRINPTTTQNAFISMNALASTGAVTAASVTNSYVQFWFQWQTLPASNSEEIFVVRAAAADKLSIRIDSSGILLLYNAAGTLVGTGTTVLSTSTWYKIEISCGSSATVGAYELKISGSSELSGTTNTSASVATNWYIGKVTNRNGNTVNFYYDDFVVSDSAFLSGDISILPMIPDADGSTMTWNLGTGASNYTQVNETPLSTADYVRSPTTGSPNIALFNLDSTATSGISGTIYAFKASIAVAENTSVTSANLIRIRSNVTNSDSGTRNTSTTFSGTYRILETDPNTGTAWTTTGLDAVQIGSVENNAISERCAFVRGTVLCVLPAPTSDIKTFLGNTYANTKTVDNLALASVKTWEGLA